MQALARFSLSAVFLLKLRRRIGGRRKSSTAPRLHRLAKARHDLQVYILTTFNSVFHSFRYSRKSQGNSGICIMLGQSPVACLGDLLFGNSLNCIFVRESRRVSENIFPFPVGVSSASRPWIRQEFCSRRPFAAQIDSSKHE